MAENQNQPPQPPQQPQQPAPQAQPTAPQPAPAPPPPVPQPPATQPAPTVPVTPVQQPPATAPAAAPTAVTPPVPPPAAPGVPKKPMTPEEIRKAKILAHREKRRKKRLMLTLFGVLFFVFILVFFIAFMILGSTGSGSNPLLQLFGLSEEQLYPFLINMTNLFMGFFVFVSFLLGVIGSFMMLMAKKEDKAGKRRGVILMVVGLVMFFLFAVIWASVYFYLQEKKAQYATEIAPLTYIVTDPEVTTGLTAPITIEFDASQLPVDPNLFTIISYVWDFGDGGTATGPTVSHRYLSKGENGGRYIVTLEVTYRDNATNEEAVEPFTVDVVINNEQVVAAFSAEPESGEMPLTVQFSASESSDPDGEIVSYEWDLDGDGDYGDAEGVTAEWTYNQFGTYTVKLRVTDNNKETNVAEFDLEVAESLRPTGTIEVDAEEGGSLFVGESYLFDIVSASSPNGAITKYEWDFGDGSNPTRNKTASHTYTKAGSYTVTLTLTDSEDKEGEVTLEVNVVAEAEAPIPVITTNKTWDDDELKNMISGTVPFVVTFYGDDSTDPNNDIVNYQWDTDSDGVIDGTGEGYEHTYRTAGTYTATLYVEDSEGNESETRITVNVGSQGVTADIQASVLTGEVPLSVTFDASGSTYPDGNIVNYEWSFGDGTTKFGTSQITYTYSSVGTYTATVTAIASDGKEASDSIFINVLPVSVSACFTSDVNSGVAPLIVTFNPGCSEGTVSSYRWDFGDGDISYAIKPTHTFESPGTYSVELRVTDVDNVQSTYTATIPVYSE